MSFFFQPLTSKPLAGNQCSGIHPPFQNTDFRQHYVRRAKVVADERHFFLDVTSDYCGIKKKKVKLTYRSIETACRQFDSDRWLLEQLDVTSDYCGIKKKKVKLTYRSIDSEWEPTKKYE